MRHVPHEDVGPYEEGLDPLLDRLPCGFVSFTDDGTIRAVNHTLGAMLGFDQTELVGHHVESIFTVGSRIFYQTHLFPLVRLRGHVDEIFLLLRAKNGDDVAVLANAARRERGNESLIDCVLLQLRERRKYEDALLAAKKSAEEARATADQQRKELDEANRAKSAFMATMSHELRTPLNAIGGYVQLLELGVHGALTPPQLETLGRVARSQRHLLRLINDLLNLARIEAGRVDYNLQTIGLHEVVQAVIPMIEPQFAARRLERVVNVAPHLEAYADRDKVEQILLNLLSNAGKFTREGGTITLEAGPAPGEPQIEVRVRDTGVGIPADQVARIFEPFVQVDPSEANRRSGTGLGLAISRELARGMGGELSAESEVGVGSVFALRLQPPRAAS
jgi:PAS domain S-box-containing protein